MHEVMDERQRLDAIGEVVDRINAMSGTHVLLVEGLKDVAALRAVGVEGEFYCVQSGGGPVRASEHVWREGRQAVILTDWDRRGGSLARQLRENLASLGVRYDDTARADLAFLCRPYCKDMESLDSVVALLEKSISNRVLVRPMSGAFIVFEGIDGAGKTTVSGRVAKMLLAEGFSPLQTAEPTSSGIGRLIRGGGDDMSQRTEAYLFCADRSDHTERISRWVGDGMVVICDRYFASTVAYQSARLRGDSADTDWLIGLSRPFVDAPDVTVLFDLDPEVSLERARARGEPLSKFENLGYLKEVRARYLELADRFGFEVVDASRPVESVTEDVFKIIRSVL